MRRYYACICSDFAGRVIVFALGMLRAARRLLLLFWAALWYGVGWGAGIVVRTLVLAAVSFLQGFADATGWERVLVWK